MNKKSLITIGISVACGILAVLLVNNYIKKKEIAINQGMQMVPVIAITEDVQAGQEISTAVIAKREVPEKYAHTNAVDPKDVELVIGQKLLFPMKRGDMLLWTSLSSKVEEAERLKMGGLANMVTKGERALSIPIDLIGGVAGMINPNDHIDILCTVHSQVSGEEATITLLQNMTVLATDQRRAGTPGKEGGYSSLTLLVTLEEAELLVFAQQKTKLVAILRNPEDIDTRQDIPKVTFSNILKSEYLKSLQKKRNTIEIIKQGRTAESK